MIKKLFHAMIIGLLSILIMAACTPAGNAASETAAPAISSSAQPTESACSATPSIDGDAVIREKLQNHHDIDRIYSAKKTREEWNTTLDRMIGYGAKISEDEKKAIIDYLLCK